MPFPSPHKYIFLKIQTKLPIKLHNGPYLRGFPILSGMKESERKSVSRVQLFATPWTVAYQASPSMGFSRQEYQSGLPFPSPGIFPTQG